MSILSEKIVLRVVVDKCILLKESSVCLCSVDCKNVSRKVSQEKYFKKVFNIVRDLFLQRITTAKNLLLLLSIIVCSIQIYFSVCMSSFLYV